MKVRILLPYFGALPSHFQLWLNSCAYNPEFEWLVVTDQSVDSWSRPPNVTFLSGTFQGFAERLANVVDTSALQSYHKICDYRPCFGLAFPDPFEGFDFWGYCDADLVFGIISQFVTSEVLEESDKS